VLAECPKLAFYVSRGVWDFGERAQVLSRVHDRHPGQGRRVTLFTDEFRTPVLVDDVVGIVEAVALARVAGTFMSVSSTY